MKTSFIGLKIGEGNHRSVHLIDNARCMKILKPFVEKSYGPLRVRLPTLLYTYAKFGIRDFNEHEHSVYQQFFSSPPNNLRGCFERIHGLSEFGLIADVVRDFDGGLSKTLEITGRVRDANFWRKLVEVREFLLENNIPLFDGVGASSIMVKKLDRFVAMPVFIDFKWLGQQLYPFQQYLRLRRFAREKTMRRFSRVFQQYCDLSQESETAPLCGKRI